MTKDDIFTPKEVSEELKLHYRTILREINRGNIFAKKVGRVYLITRDEIQRYTSTTPKPRNLEVAVAIVRKNNKILMVKRKRKEGKLLWQFPAGIIRYSEKSSTRAEIECLEETGVHCKVEKYFGKRIHPDTHVIIHYWLCKFIEGKVYNADTSENAEVRWVTKKEALSLGTTDYYLPVKKYLQK